MVHGRSAQPRVRAVVAEGVINRSNADTRNLAEATGSAAGGYWRVAFRGDRIQTHGLPPPEPLTDAFRAVAARPLLLITAEQDPVRFEGSPAYRRAAGPTATSVARATRQPH